MDGFHYAEPHDTANTHNIQNQQLDMVQLNMKIWTLVLFPIRIISNYNLLLIFFGGQQSKVYRVTAKKYKLPRREVLGPERVLPTNYNFFKDDFYLYNF